jgi:hypothetical protein
MLAAVQAMSGDYSGPKISVEFSGGQVLAYIILAVSSIIFPNSLIRISELIFHFHTFQE